MAPSSRKKLTVPKNVYKEYVQNETYLQYICSRHQGCARISVAVSNIVERSSQKGKSQRCIPDQPLLRFSITCRLIQQRLLCHLPSTVERAVIKSLSTVKTTKQSSAVVGS